MSGRLRACSSYQRTSLSDKWELGATPSRASSADAPPNDVQWSHAQVPGTVASSLRNAGLWSLDSFPRQFDGEEWWYRAQFSAEPSSEAERCIVGLEGLATFAQVRLNDTLLVDSSNMFIEHQCDVTSLLRPVNDLVIRFSSLDAYLAMRRRRPRWRTPMVQHQQLRWARTTLLGRAPGWTPPAAPVGPWRPVWLERRRWVDVADFSLDTSVVGNDGRVCCSCAITLLGGATLKSARLVAERNGVTGEANLELSVDAAQLRGDLTLRNVDRWWPHTHGEPALYRIGLLLEVRDSAGAEHCVDADLGSAGFRTLRLDRDAGQFTLYVNEHRIFCRGAAWTPLDCVSLQASGADYHEAIGQVRNAGMNMLRVPGPLVYESDAFLDAMDAAGVLLWQDLMFANMDYPEEDAAFAASVKSEVRQQLSRLQGRPSLALICGNSEGAQQAAMSGAPRECWAPPLFEVELSAVAREICREVPYCPSSAHGGAFPFQVDQGVTSYYGVGAYLKPLTDSRRSGVRFASECLAFSNIPENETVAAMSAAVTLRSHHPRWKERVPRDLGAGWDFEDVRDHYLERLFRIDPRELRYADHDRYLRLGRVATGEVMAASFAEWRRSASTCQGALMLFLRDLWPGAGWGLIDSTGLPKAAYYCVRRVLQPLTVFVTDEDCNGLALHLVNDAQTAPTVRLQVQLFRYSTPVGTAVSKTLTLAPGSSVTIPATDLYEGFMDLSYSFRFGPPSYDVLHAVLLGEDDARLCETFHFPQGLPNRIEGDIGLAATVAPTGDAWRVEIRTRHFAQSVHIEMPGFIPDDQYFHMSPDSARALTLRRRKGSAAQKPEGLVHALNAARPCPITLAP